MEILLSRAKRFMAISSLQPIVACPMCRGTRYELSLKHHGQFECGMCKGCGWVLAHSCKGCGRPALKSWPPKQVPFVWYCGLETCLAVLIRIHKPGTVVYYNNNEDTEFSYM